LEWDCLDDDPTRADAVFIPYCVALNVLHYVLDPVLNASVRHDADLSVFLAREQPHFCYAARDTTRSWWYPDLCGTTRSR